MIKIENLSNSIKKRFIKDWKLPINITQEPIFSYQINLLDKDYNTIQKLDFLIETINKLGGEELFFQEFSKISETVIESIKRKNAYKKLELDRLSEMKQIVGIKHKDIYNIANVGANMLSIDLNKANFQALNSYSDELVLKSKNYDELISKFTDFEYFKESKQIRQVVFGNLLPKKQQRIQKNIMNEIYLELKKIGVKEENLINASADEIVIKLNSKDEIQILEKLIEEKIDLPKLNFRIETFELQNIGNRKYFVKEHYSGDIEFKSVPSIFFMQAYKEYKDLDLEENDLKFFHEGQMASFEESHFNIEKNGVSIDEIGN